MNHKLQRASHTVEDQEIFNNASSIVRAAGRLSQAEIDFQRMLEKSQEARFARVCGPMSARQ